MIIKKRKEDKLIERPIEERNEITTRRPFDLWADFDRMFDRFRKEFDELLWPLSRTGPTTIMTANRTPLLDIADLGDRYEMKVEMPGIPKENINIEVTSTGVEISAEHKESKEDKSKNWLRKERKSMSFYRALELPEELKTDNVDAELKDGVLTVKLPKVKPKPAHRPKKVQIK